MEDPWKEPAPTDLSNRVIALLEILLVAGLGDLLVIPLTLQVARIPVSRVMESSTVLFAVLMSKATVTLLLVLLLLRFKGETLRTIGWRARPLQGESWRGLLFVPVLFATMGLVAVLFEYFGPQYVTRENPLLVMLDRPSDVLLFLLSSFYVGGLQEEVQRAFILDRFRQHLGGPVVGLVLWSIAFGLGHAVQGIDNMVKAGILGLLFGLLYLRRGDLTSPIVAHAVFNSVTVLVFWFALRS